MSYPAYPEYKDSGVEWLGAVPAHWEVLPLKFVVSTPVTDGPHETPDFIEDGVPFISAEAVSTGRIDFDKAKFISRDDHDRYSRKYSPKKHDIYMVKSGATTGVTAIVEDDREFNIWSPLAVIRCKNGVNPYFVLQSMRSTNFQESVVLNWSFGTQQNIGMGVIENLPVNTPPESEQVEIAAFLDHETARIDALVEEQQRLIELLKEKRQALISHAVTKGLDPDVPMKDSGVSGLPLVPTHWKVINFGITNKKATLGGNYNSSEESDGTPIIKMGNISRGNAVLGKVERLAADDFFEKEHELKYGDFLFNTRNSLDLVGKVCVWKEELQEAAYNSNVLKIDFSSNLVSSSFYMSYLFNSSLLIGLLRTYAKGTTSVAAIYYKDLQSIPIPLPPKNEQIEIVRYLNSEIDKIDRLYFEVKEITDVIKERRSALISAAVTGKIDVRGWRPPAVSAVATGDATQLEAV